MSVTSDIKYIGVNDYDIDLSASKTFPFYGTVYEDNAQFISDTLKNYGDYYEAVKDASIENFEILANGVSRTDFNNRQLIQYIQFSHRHAG